MDNEQLLPVVTVTYSSGEHVESFLRTLADAYAGPTEVVLADNGSTDGSHTAADAAHEHVHAVDTGGNLGYGAGMNAGVCWLSEHGVEGEFLLLSNPDVCFAPGAVDELIAAARRHPRAGAVGPRIVEPDGATYPSARAVPTMATGIGHALLAKIWPANPWSRVYHADADMEHERTAGWLSGACLLVRREAFAAVGGFDERYFMYLEDVDLGDRLARAGYENVYCPTAIIHHAQGHSTSSRPQVSVRAHHRSAYRFQADRHPAWWQAPVRGAVRLGLAVRERVILAAQRRRSCR